MKRLRSNPALLLGVAFLLLQAVLVFRARFVAERFFCWAPFDESSHYEVKTWINDRPLSDTELWDRYQYRIRGWENRSVHNVIRMVRQFETSYGTNHQARVEVIYSYNGHPEQTWRWPQR